MVTEANKKLFWLSVRGRTLNVYSQGPDGAEQGLLGKNAESVTNNLPSVCLGSHLALARRGPSNRPGLIHRPSHRYVVAFVMPNRRWNPLLQPELDGLHVKQTQLNYRRRPSILWKALSGQATGSRGRAGVFREEVSHHLRQLLSFCEAFSKALHSWQLVQTGCLTKPERGERVLCPPLSSPSSWARGGAPTL